MTSGGARANSGPAPDPNSLRRGVNGTSKKADEQWITLPASGRDGDTPKFPLDAYTNREAVVWAQMWQKPQAIMWEKLGLEWEVALFVRRMVQMEQHASSSQNATLVRQMMDSLGLTTPGMRNNRWQLSEDELSGRRLERDELPRNRYSASGRIKKATG